MKDSLIRLVLVFVLLFVATGNAFARDAAFLDPGAANAGAGEEAVKVDPKADIDIGETVLNVAKRTSVFFVNQTNVPVKIEKVVVTGDSDVTADASANDCTKQGVIEPLSRCSVEVSATPISVGTWSIDVLMTHNGAGRITRARLTGKTAGTGVSENKSTGLAVNAKESKPIEFGEVEIGDGKVVRSALMVNDSPDPITIYAIDVIEADNGLQRLEQGCAVDMELAPGASCPVTLMWVPEKNGPVSTDLIIRHSGKMGFAVIPIRGIAKGGVANNASGPKDKGADKPADKGAVPLPPSAQDLEKEMAKVVAPVPGAALNPSPGSDALHLIGTIGDRALVLKPSGDTAVIAVGDEFTSNGRVFKVTSVGARSADILIDGSKKITLPLEASSMLVSKANQEAQDEAAQKAAAVAAATPAPIPAVGGKK